MTAPDSAPGPLSLGLRTVIYHVKSLDQAKAWYEKAFRVAPYFDQPFYVGFEIGGYELGLDPDPTGAPPGPGGAVAYWGVEQIDEAFAHLVACGARVISPIQAVGGDIQVAVLADPFGNLMGIIENPQFQLKPA